LNHSQLLLKLIKQRRSIRHYTNQPVSHETIVKLLEAAIWAPSAHNRQPWRFAVITGDADKSGLARAMGTRLRADRAADGDPSDEIEQDINRSYARLTGAPVLIVLCTSLADMDSYPDQRRARNEETMATQSTAMAGQNILLMAHTMGLGACWLCAPLFVPDLVRETLKLPSDWEPQGLITLGYPAHKRDRTRARLEEKTLFVSG
jgi:F420 biosynthesis protein FbiB-like protein